MDKPMTRSERRPERPRRLVLIDQADKEAALFFVRWLKAPHRIGAVTPSSRQLGRAMARQVLSAGPGPIIELGGGTGSVTRALLGELPERERGTVEVVGATGHHVFRRHMVVELAHETLDRRGAVGRESLADAAENAVDSLALLLLDPKRHGVISLKGRFPLLR
jgi:hypothetical protein